MAYANLMIFPQLFCDIPERHPEAILTNTYILLERSDRLLP